jgi:hypothetical protein
MSYIIFGPVEGVYGPQNTPMLWQCIFAGTKEHFEFNRHPQPPPPPIHPQAWRVVAHPFDVLAWSARPHLGRRGPFLLVVAMIVVVVMRVVFCAEPTEILKNAKNT